MKILIPTCDKYRNILEANQYSMDIAGGDNLEITILGYKAPDFNLGSWKFVSLGTDSGANNFTNDLIPFFKEFDDEYFIYGNDDCIITNKFNHSLLNDITEMIKDIPNFGRIWLTQTPMNYYGGGKIIKVSDNYQIGEINQSGDYRLSLQYSLWKTSYFKKYLVPNLNPWEWEVRNTAKNDGASILLPINNFVVSVGHVMKRGEMLTDWHKSIYDDGTLLKPDVDIINNIFNKHNIC